MAHALGLTPAQTRAPETRRLWTPPLRCAGLSAIAPFPKNGKVTGSPYSRSLRGSLAHIPDLAKSPMPPPAPGVDNGVPCLERNLVTPTEQASNRGTPQGAAGSGPFLLQATTTDAPACFRMVPPLHRGEVLVDVVFMFLVSVFFALHLRGLVGGPGQVVPSVDSSHWPPRVAALFSERAKKPETNKKT